MAVNVANLTAGVGVLDPQVTAPVTPSSGAVLYVAVSVSKASGAVDDSIGVSGLSATWTKLATQAWASRRRTWWYRGVGATGTGTISFDYTGTGTLQEIGWVVDEATGLDGTTPDAGGTVSTAGEGTSTTRTVTTATSPAAGDATWSALSLETNTNATPEAGWTALGQTTTGTLGVRRVETAWDDAHDQSCAWTWGGTDIGNAAFIVILKAGAGGVSGAAASALPSLAQSAEGAAVNAAAATSALGPLAQAAAGTVARVGAGASTLPELAAAAEATAVKALAAAAVLPALAQTAAGTVTRTAAAASALPPLRSDAAATVGRVGVAASPMPALEQAAVGRITRIAVAASALPAMSTAAAGAGAAQSVTSLRRLADSAMPPTTATSRSTRITDAVTRAAPTSATTTEPAT